MNYINQNKVMENCLSIAVMPKLEEYTTFSLDDLSSVMVSDPPSSLWVLMYRLFRPFLYVCAPKKAAETP